jgi:hypothetical protein
MNFRPMSFKIESKRHNYAKSVGSYLEKTLDIFYKTKDLNSHT